MSAEPCKQCGAIVAADAAYFDDDGAVICTLCHGELRVEQEQRPRRRAALLRLGIVIATAVAALAIRIFAG